MEGQDVAAVLASLGAALEGPGFLAWNQSFIQEHVAKFDYGDENKLEYTQVHRLYVEGLEGFLAQALPAGATMAAVEATLMENPHLVDRLDGASSAAVKTLVEAGDFVAFREMMLFEKQKREQAAAVPDVLQQQTGSSIPDLEGILDKCVKLARMADASGWENVTRNDWMVLDKMAVPEAERSSSSEIYLRGVWTMDLSVMECCDMMWSFTDRRSAWDKNFAGAKVIKGGGWGEDDLVITANLDFGFLMHMAGIPRKLTSRNWRRWNYPTPGIVTSAMIPWTEDTDEFDANNSILTLKVLSIGHHPTDPGKCIMTTIESNKMGMLPTWVLGMLMSVTAPQLMKGLEGRYIANVRKTGGTVDVTPSGFCR